MAKHQKHADTNQKHGPNRAESNIAGTQRFEFESYSQQRQESAPEPSYWVAAGRKFVSAEVYEQQRPQLIRSGESELIQQQNYTQNQNDDADDEVAICATRIQ